MKNYSNPASTVDLIVPREGGLLLVRRKHEPFEDDWAFPGGFLNNGKESLEEAGCRELFEETTLMTDPNNLKLVGVYSSPKRDPRGHVIAHVYEVLQYAGVPKAADDAAEVRVYKEKPEKMAFDHSQIWDDYFSQRRVQK